MKTLGMRYMLVHALDDVIVVECAVMGDQFAIHYGGDYSCDNMDKFKECFNDFTFDRMVNYFNAFKYKVGDDFLVNIFGKYVKNANNN